MPTTRRHIFSRLTNLLRCRGSYLLSLLGVCRVRYMPTFVSVEPANFCQLACPECPVGMRHAQPDKQRGVMSMDMFRRIVDEVAPYARVIQLFWQGDPLLNDRLPEMISLAHQAGLYTIVSTNAQRLDLSAARALAGAGLNRVIVSLDGWTQQTYEQYRRGGNVEQAKQAIRFLRQARQETGARMLIELQCLRLKTNEQEWELFRKGYRALGADFLTMKTAQLYDFAQGSPLMPSDTRYARYRWDKSIRQYVPKHGLRNRCQRLWSGCVIDVCGDVMPCCYDKSKQHTFGNILRQPLADIWHGEQAEQFRMAVLRRRRDIPICTNCE